MNSRFHPPLFFSGLALSGCQGLAGTVCFFGFFFFSSGWAGENLRRQEFKLFFSFFGRINGPPPHL